MPRRRRRTTNRVPQDQRHLRVRGVRRGTPDARKLSRAFIGLALAQAEAEARAQVEAATRTAKGDGPGGRDGRPAGAQRGEG